MTSRPKVCFENKARPGGHIFLHNQYRPTRTIGLYSEQQILMLQGPTVNFYRSISAAFRSDSGLHGILVVGVHKPMQRSVGRNQRAPRKHTNYDNAAEAAAAAAPGPA